MLTNIPRALIGLIVLGLAVIIASAVFGKGFSFASKGL